MHKNYPVSVEGAFNCDSLNVDFKGGMYKRPKRLHYDFLPDFIVRLTGFDYKRKLFFLFRVLGFKIVV